MVLIHPLWPPVPMALQDKHWLFNEQVALQRLMTLTSLCCLGVVWGSVTEGTVT